MSGGWRHLAIYSNAVSRDRGSESLPVSATSPAALDCRDMDHAHEVWAKLVLPAFVQPSRTSHYSDHGDSQFCLVGMVYEYVPPSPICVRICTTCVEPGHSCR